MFQEVEPERSRTRAGRVKRSGFRKSATGDVFVLRAFLPRATDVNNRKVDFDLTAEEHMGAAWLQQRQPPDFEKNDIIYLKTPSQCLFPVLVFVPVLPQVLLHHLPRHHLDSVP